jgi:hypothetical protein
MNSNTILNLVENFQNGNITDAQNSAKRIGWRSLFLALRQMGMSEPLATNLADCLKKRISFTQYCDNRLLIADHNFKAV